MILTKEERDYDKKLSCKDIPDERFFNSYAVKNLQKFIKHRNGLTKKGLIIKGVNKELSYYRKQTVRGQETNKLMLFVDVECPKCHSIKHELVNRMKNELNIDRLSIRCNCERDVYEKYKQTASEIGKKIARHGLTHELWYKRFVGMNYRAEKENIDVSPDWKFHASHSVDDLENPSKTKKNYFNFVKFVEKEFKSLGLEFDEDASSYRLYLIAPEKGYNKDNCYIKPTWMSSNEVMNLKAKNSGII